MANAQRTQVLIALIGVVGALGAAALANWDKLFPPPAAPSAPIAVAPVAIPAQQKTQVPVPQPAASEPVPLITVADVSGLWVDNFGSRYTIRQEGSAFSFDAFNSMNGVRVTGRGTLNGEAFDFEYNTNTQVVGGCKGTLSADRNTMAANCVDTETPAYELELKR
jgi:hypothetical protein